MTVIRRARPGYDWTHPDHPSHRRGPWKARTGAGIGVVAARFDQGIVRAVNPIVFERVRAMERLVNSVLIHVGSLRGQVEWTGFVYPSEPSYLHYGNADGWPDMRNIERPSGVWLWKWASPPTDCYIGSTQRDGIFLGPLVGR